MNKNYTAMIWGTTIIAVLSTTACQQISASIPGEKAIENTSSLPKVAKNVNVTSPTIKKLLNAAYEQTKYTRSYDPAYVPLKYPGGDVPLETGVCTDVVIRAFRQVGVDLQKEVHEDMRRSFAVYPRIWGLQKPDTNIDHRRVPNLMTYFKRKGKALRVTNKKEKYLPGDVVTWNLGNGQQHIGVVSNTLSPTSGNPQIIHNIGAGTKEEDILFNWKITGHYRYFK